MKLKSYNGNPPRFNILPKIHKDGNPARPVTSFPGSPLKELFRLIGTPIQKIIGKTSTYVKDSWHLTDILKRFKVPSGYSLVSLDVKSLYTNIPITRVTECLKNNYKEIKKHTNIPEDNYIELI